MIDYRERESLRGISKFKRLITILKPDGTMRSILTIDNLYTYTANEYRIALQQAGFSTATVYGDYREDTKEAPSSPRIVVVAHA